MVYPTVVTEYFSTRFEWNERRNEAAALLAHGKTQLEVAAAVNVTPKTIYNWLQDMEFAAEVDRLSLMVGIASRAQRLRWLNKTIANRINADGSLQTDKDVVDLIKIAISETDGVKIDLSKLSEMVVSEVNESQAPALPLAIDIEAQDIVGPVSDNRNQLLDQQPATTSDD